MSTEHTLPAELTIYTVAEMHPILMDWVSEPKALRLLASDVSEVDAAGVQLLIGMARYLSARDEQLTLINASHQLVKACETLGVTNFLTMSSSGDDHGH